MVTYYERKVCCVHLFVAIESNSEEDTVSLVVEFVYVNRFSVLLATIEGDN